MQDKAIAMQTNWKDLPPELLRVIFQKLRDIGDFIRVRAVCKPWYCSTSISDFPAQFPWIMRLARGPQLKFYSTVFDKVYTTNVPSSHDKRLFGPAAGYMLACHNRLTKCLSLLNPLNNSEIPLPVLSVPHKFWNQLCTSWIGPPSFERNHHVIFADRDQKLVACRPGDRRWDVITKPRSNLRYRYFYLKDLLFMIDGCTEFTKVMDITSRKVLYIIPPSKDETSGLRKCRAGPYLVESGREILRVSYYDYYNKETCDFDIHRLELGTGEGRHCWVKVRSINDLILFLDFQSERGFSLSVNDFTALKGNSTDFKNKVRCYTKTGVRGVEYEFAEFKGNRIYFIHTERRQRERIVLWSVGDCHAIKMYDIDSSKTYCIDNPFGVYGAITWFMPTLNCINIT